MNEMKNLVTLIIITIVFTINVNAQKNKKTETLTIKTSTQCGMCKERVEKAMVFEKGIVSSELDIDKQQFTIVYKPSKTTPEKIRQAISKTGYDADNIKAEGKAYSKLPDCCKKGGHFD